MRYKEVFMFSNTIAAVSTPAGVGGIAVIRISGDGALEVAQKVFRSKGRCPEHGRSVYGEILSGDRVIDDGIMVYFKAPHSFTGEDTVEISCHGGRVITSMVLGAVLDAGAVQAKAGEFTKRAFVNGKLTLTRAEGIGDLLEAKTEEAAFLSSSSARGRLSDELSDTADRLTALIASLYAYIDYPDEDLQDLTDGEILAEIDFLKNRAARLVASFETGRAVTEGILTMIVGKPNVGKSSFFNKMLGEKRAIVTDISGTTRDMLEYPVKAGKVLLRLCDTAGLRGEGADEIEKIGISMVLERLSASDTELVLALFDGSRPLDDDDRAVISRLSRLDARVIPIITKSDLDRVIDAGEIEASLGRPEVISCEKDELGGVVRRIEESFVDGNIKLGEDAVLTNRRHLSCIMSFSKLLDEASASLRLGTKDITGSILERALGVICETDGRGADERIVNEIFSRFCVGK